VGGEQDNSNERAADIEGGVSPAANPEQQHGDAQLSDELRADPDGQPFSASNHEEWERVLARRQDRPLRCAELMERRELVVITGWWERHWYSAHLNSPDGALQAFCDGVRRWFAVARYPNVPRLPLFSEVCDLSRAPALSLNWSTIEIVFLSDHRVQITVTNGGTETLNYAEFGFSNRRNGKPTKAWEILRMLAERDGRLRELPGGRGNWSHVEKRIQEIRKVLRRRYSTTNDPLPFVDGEYRASFGVRCGPSFDA
jgi:hypothetical protein